MKKFYIAALAILISASALLAQAPSRFSYQAVVRNSGGNLVANSQVSVRITIHKGSATGASQFVERHANVSTNENGLATLAIGAGTLVSGNLANINWTNDAYFIKTEIDPANGTNYSISGTSQVLAAPYALNGVLNGRLGIGGVASDTDFLRVLSGSARPTSISIGRTAREADIGIANGGGEFSTSAVEGDVVFRNNSATKKLHLGAGIGSAALTVSGTSVGIGTTNPAAPMHVNGLVNSNSGNTFVFYSRATNGQPSTGVSVQQVNDVSIIASNRIRASEFNAMSDARIKDIIGISNSHTDLQTLGSIKVTDYTFKDKVERGNRVIKKVIAQELEQVFPNAVSQTTEVIPDVFEMASISGGKVACKNNFKKGEKVKLVFENATEVLEIMDANPASFQVASKKEGKVFVYGREVSDFRVVDYEALSTLNISATQELAKKVAALEAENAALKAENKEAKANFQSQLDEIKASLQGLLPTDTAKK